MDADIKLIQLVKRSPHLYDKKHEKYKDRNLAENSWAFISKEMNLPADACANRWHALRNRFSKERSKFTPSESGSTASKVWPLLKHLEFLNTVVKKRKTFGKVLGDVQEEVPPKIFKTDTQDEEDEETKGFESSFELSTSEDFLEELEEPESALQQTNTNTLTNKVLGTSRSSSETSQNGDGVTAELSETVNALRTLTQRRNAESSKDASIRCFCDSLFHDLKSMDPSKLRKCKIEILKQIDLHL